MTEEIMALNATIQGKHESKVADAVNISGDGEITICDSLGFHRFCKKPNSFDTIAVQAYKDWMEALKKIKSGGISIYLFRQSGGR